MMEFVSWDDEIPNMMAKPARSGRVEGTSDVFPNHFQKGDTTFTKPSN
jgi:hypothetical protein